MDTMATKQANRRIESDQKDRGYAWVILAVCTTLRVIFAMCAGMSGVLLISLSQKYDGKSKVLLNTTASIPFGVAMMAGIFTSMLMVRFGVRNIICIGSVLATFGYASSAFLENLYGVLIMYSFVAALGGSAYHVGSIIAVQTYFDKRRGFAQGLTMAGFGAAVFIWPPMVEFLLRHYGLSGTFLFLAGLQLQGLVLGALLRPFPSKHLILELDDVNEVSTVHNCEHEGEHNLAAQHISRKKNKLDFGFFRNINFMMFAAADLLQAMNIDYLYLPRRGIAMGRSGQEAALLVSIIGIFNGTFRFIGGAVSDIAIIKPHRLLLCALCLTVSGSFRMLLPFLGTYLYLALYAGIQGMLNGIYVGILYTAALDIAGIQYAALVTGIISFTGGVGNFLAGPFAGWLESISGGITLPFLGVGASMSLGGLMNIVNYCHLRCRKSKTTQML